MKYFIITTMHVMDCSVLFIFLFIHELSLPLKINKYYKKL